MRRDEDTTLFLFYLAFVSALKGHVGDSIELFKKVINEDPNFGEAHYNLAWLYFFKGDRSSSSFHLRQANELGAPDELISELRKLVPEFKEEKSENIILRYIKENRLNIIPSLSIVLIVGFFSLRFLGGGYLGGWDSMAHVFKAWYMRESFLGRADLDWCNYWYLGSPIIPTYGPLFYFFSSITSIIFNLEVLTSSKWIVFLSFPISSLSFYYSLKREESITPYLIGAILYGLIPWNLNYIKILGNPTYSICFVFIPPLFKYVTSNTKYSTILSSIFYSAIFLSHQATGFLLGYALIPLTVFHHFISGGFKDQLKKVIIIGLLSIGLLGFFWIPYVYYTVETSSFKSIFAWGDEIFVKLFDPTHYMYLGPLFFGLWLISCLFVVFKRDEEGLHYSLLSMFTVIVSVGYRHPWVGFFYPIKTLVGPGLRMNVISSFAVVMTLVRAISLAPSMLKFDRKVVEATLTVVIVGVVLFTNLSVYEFVNPSIPSSHKEIFSIVANDVEDGRVWWVPRTALSSSIPMFTGKATPDGWYDQGANEEMYSMIHDLNDRLLLQDPSGFIEAISDLSVRYLIVSGNSLIHSLDDTDGVKLVQAYPDIALFSTEDIEPLRIYDKPKYGDSSRGLGIVLSLSSVAGIILHIKTKYKITL